MKPVYEYLDYRNYLKDYYEERKGSCPFFSYRYWAGKMGSDASNIAKIMAKKRHASKSSIAKFIEFVKFDSREQAYFLLLVKFNRAKSEVDARKIFESLLAMKDVKTETIKDRQYEFYSKWYHTAIFALLYFYKFSGKAFRELAQMLSPQISAEEAKQSVALLEKLGMIYADKNGVYRHTKELISTGEEWQSLAVHSFQEATIKLALQSLRTQPRMVRDMSSVSLTVNKEEYEKIKELTAKYRKEVLSIARASENPDRVCHLNIQLFPMTVVPEIKGDN